MAKSICGKCGGSSFENVEVTPKNSNFKLNFTQCASCGVVVGIADFFNIGALLLEQNRALETIAAKVNATVKFKE